MKMKSEIRDAVAGSHSSVPGIRFSKLPRAADSVVASETGIGKLQPANCDLQTEKRGGFTLIELLIVIAIMSILAAMIIPISGAVTRSRIRARARAELEQVSTAIELYKAKLGHYPPDNPGNPATNQLYFELLGTTLSNRASGPFYTTLDGSAYIAASDLPSVFGPNVGGFINSSQGLSSDEGRVVSSFLKGLKPSQVAVIYSPGNDLVKILVSSAPSQPNRFYNICYVSSSPTNNPNAFALWVDVPISGKTNRISNWSQQITTLP